MPVAKCSTKAVVIRTDKGLINQAKLDPECSKQGGCGEGLTCRQVTLKSRPDPVSGFVSSTVFCACLPADFPAEYTDLDDCTAAGKQYQDALAKKGLKAVPGECHMILSIVENPQKQSIVSAGGQCVGKCDKEKGDSKDRDCSTHITVDGLTTTYECKCIRLE